MRLNANVEHAPGYPFLRLAQARRDARAEGIDVTDLSMGEPTEPAAPVVREALVAAAASESLCHYPSAAGLPELREAIAAWIARRFCVELDEQRELLPTLGAKEPIALLARLFAERGDTIAVGSPSYPVPERSAHAADLRVHSQTLSAAGAWLPDPEAIPWDSVAIVWVVSPHNPTGALAPLALLDELARRCRRSGAILAVDETYSEFWYEREPPSSALQLADRSGVVVFNSLSKRSSLAGLRSGFLAGDAAVVERIRRHRSDIGTTPQAFVQRASIAAWNDESHVQRARERYARNRELLAAAARTAGLADAGGPAGIFLWLAVTGGDDLLAYERLLDASLLVVPGSYLGAGGEGHLRVALTPREQQVQRAAELLRRTSLHEALATASPRGRARARSA